MKIGLLSLGCPKNLVDGEVMLGLAEQAGHEITSDARAADALIVNTCAFIDRAKQESVDAILEMAALKAQAAGRRLIVTGCLAERYREELQAEIPEIDAVLGTGEVARIVEILAATRSRQPAAAAGGRPSPVTAPNTSALAFYRRDPAASTPSLTDPGRGDLERRASMTIDHAPASPVFGVDLPTYLYDAETPRRLTTPGHYAYLKIAEGCDYKCAFCIIPKMRGKYRSRDSESIVREARQLAARGVKELLLISQDTTFYGIDRGRRGALAPLLRGLDDVDGLEWIRLLYLYPTTITDEILQAMALSRKVCKYIDLPLQHASDAVLRRMKRPGTRASYEKLLHRIRVAMPDVALRTTFIVGFPGETDTDVEELLRFVEAVKFDHVGVFTYSAEEGTSAFHLNDDVPPDEKERRRAAIMGAQRSIVGRRLRASIGRRATVLVDGPDEEHELVWRARLSSQAPDIDSRVYLTDCDPAMLAAGRLLDVEIIEANGYDLVGRPV